MADELDVASPTDTQASEPAAKAESAKPELKSRDTGFIKTLQEKTETATPPKAIEPKAKPDTDAASADKEDHADSEADHPDEKTIPSWMKKRLARAEEKGRKAGRDQTLEEIRTLRSAPAEPVKEQAPAKAPQPAAKTLADFDFDIERYTDYVAEQKAEQAFSKREAARERARQEKTAAEARTAFEKRKSAFEQRVGDGAWDEMVTAKVDVPQSVIDLLTGHDKDLDIAHYLVHHPAELDKLKGQSKLAIARELTAIEARLGGSGGDELPPKTTKTPAPPPSVQGAGRSSKSLDDMSTAERIAHWRQQKQNRR